MWGLELMYISQTSALWDKNQLISGSLLVLLGTMIALCDTRSYFQTQTIWIFIVGSIAEKYQL